MQPLRRCPFCGGYWEVMPIPQTYRYSAIGICAGCGAMVMTTYEHTTLASAIDELIRRINARETLTAPTIEVLPLQQARNGFHVTQIRKARKQSG